MPETLHEETMTGWGVSPDEIAPVPLPHRTAVAWKRARERWANRLFGVLFADMKAVWDLLTSRALWNDIGLSDVITLSETQSERPAAFGDIAGHDGLIFVKVSDKDEAIYFKARARYSDGSVRIRLKTASTVEGGIVFSVAASRSLEGPWTTFLPNQALINNPGAVEQTLEIPLSPLAVGEIQYYRLVRERDNSADTLDADVVAYGIQVR